MVCQLVSKAELLLISGNGSPALERSPSSPRPPSARQAAPLMRQCVGKSVFLPFPCTSLSSVTTAGRVRERGEERLRCRAQGRGVDRLFVAGENNRGKQIQFSLGLRALEGALDYRSAVTEDVLRHE